MRARARALGLVDPSAAGPPGPVPDARDRSWRRTTMRIMTGIIWGGAHLPYTIGAGDHLSRECAEKNAHRRCQRQETPCFFGDYRRKPTKTTRNEVPIVPARSVQLSAACQYDSRQDIPALESYRHGVFTKTQRAPTIRARECFYRFAPMGGIPLLPQ